MWYDLADNVRSGFLLQYTTFSEEKPKDLFFAREEKYFMRLIYYQKNGFLTILKLFREID